MPRKPRDFDAELHALMDKAKKLKGQKTAQLGELVRLTGADALPIEALAGALLAAVDHARQQPEATARWTERGQAFFHAGPRRDRRPANGGGPAPRAAGDGHAAAAHDGGAA